MRQLTISPNNRQYYSEDFCKGFNCGAQRQFEADKSDADRPQEWIPCSERLPNESGYYLSTIEDAFGDAEICVIWFAHSKDYNCESEWREITDEDTVLAWMPLPKPYGERKGE